MENCYLNGEFLPYEKCMLHVSDLQLQRGYGVFDYFRVRAGEIRFLDDYADRLFNSIHLAGFETDFNREELYRVLDKLNPGSEVHEAAFKVLVTGGYSENLGAVSGSPNIMVLCLPYTPQPRLSFREGVRLVSDRFQRPNPEIKTMYYFNSLRLRQKMQQAGAVDVLYHTDLLTETSRASVFFVRDASVYTTQKDILDGITRKQLLRQFPEIKEADLSWEEFGLIDELFLSSTTREVTPVISVDGRPVGNGKPGVLTREIQQAFH